MRSLIRIFARRTCPKVGFLTFWLHHLHTTIDVLCCSLVIPMSLYILKATRLLQTNTPNKFFKRLCLKPSIYSFQYTMDVCFFLFFFCCWFFFWKESLFKPLKKRPSQLRQTFWNIFCISQRKLCFTFHANKTISMKSQTLLSLKVIEKKNYRLLQFYSAKLYHCLRT